MNSYCDVDLVRNISGLTVSEIKGDRIRSLRDQVVVPKINKEIFTTVEDEVPEQLSDGISFEGSNYDDIYRLREIANQKRELADLNDDGQVTAEDIYAWIDLYENRREYTVSEFNPATGEFVLSEEVPDEADLHVRYRHSPVSVAEPNYLLSVACAQLTGAFCFSNIETKKLKNFSIGDTTIRKQSQGFQLLHDQYRETRRQLLSRESVKTGENKRSTGDYVGKGHVGGRPLGSGKSFFTGIR